MKPVAGIHTRRTRGYFLFWKSFFVVMVLLLLGVLFYATKQVDYVWRWNRIPTYFYYEETIETTSMIEGEVDSIEQTPAEDDGVVVVVAGDGEEEAYRIPPGGELRVSEGDFIYPGDILGVHHAWRVGLFLEGLWVTMKVSVLAIAVGVVLGLMAGLARLSHNPALRWTAMTYIELIRGSPLLVQIFVWYFVFGTIINQLLAQYGLSQPSPLWYGVASLATFSGAYIAEIVRAGVQSVHRGQLEASRSLGMSSVQCMRHVVLPQAFKRILPPLAGQFISLIKDSSLLGVIAIREVTKATREAVSSSLMPFELWLLCAALYLVLTFSLSMALQYMEKRMMS